MDICKRTADTKAVEMALGGSGNKQSNPVVYSTVHQVSLKVDSCRYAVVSETYPVQFLL